MQRDDWDAGLDTGDRGTAEYRARMLKLEAKREALAALPQRAERWEEVGTGQTFADVWAGIADDTAARRAFLLKTVRVIVHASPVTIPSRFPGEPPHIGSRVAVRLTGNWHCLWEGRRRLGISFAGNGYG